MSARARRHTRALTALIAGLGLLAAPAHAPGADAVTPPTQAAPLSGLRGSGDYSRWVERLACVGCIGAIYYSAGGTPLGFLMVGIIRSEAIVGCGWICYGAVT